MENKPDQSEHKEMYGCALMILAFFVGIAAVIWAYKH